MAGLAIVVYLFNSIGWAEVSDHLIALGWLAPLIFLPSLLINYINTWAWVFTFPPPFSKYQLPFSRLFWIRICGDFINNFTPTAHVGGDLTRVWCLKKYNVSSTIAFVTAIMDKAALIITEILFIYTGIFLLLARVDWPITSRIWVGSSLLLALGAIYGVAGAVHKGFFSKISGTLSRSIRWRALWRFHGKVKHLDTHLTQFYRNHHKEFLRSNVLHFVAWVVGALETWAMLYLLGKPVGIVDAVIIEALITLAKGLGFLIPASLGVFEAGSVIFFQLLDLGQGLGLAFSLLKRARELFIGGLAWVVFSIQYSSVKKLREPQTQTL